MIKLRQRIESKSLNYDLAIAETKSDKVALVLLREKKRWLCRNDLFYLCGITGNSEITKYPDYYRPFCDEVSLMNWKLIKENIEPLHPEMFKVEDITDNPDEDLKYLKRLYLAHRIFYKTTIVSKVHSLQLLLNFPNTHIVLAGNKQENASDNLVAIKNYFLTTDIGKLFPEYIPQGKEWGNMTGFSVAIRTDLGRTEDNIEAIGEDTEITGRHWKIAKKNDLVTIKSVNTEELIKKTISWDARFDIGHFDNPELPIQDYEGTRYHNADLYAVKKNDPNIKLIEIPLLKDQNPQNLSIENISNPKRFTSLGIKMMQHDMWEFMCQHILKPEDPARNQFKMEMIQYFGVIPDCNFYLFVDPASKRKKKSDFTVMLVVGVDNENNKYIVDGIRDKLDPKQRIDQAIALAIKWTIKGCGWEAIAFQETDCFYLEEERRKKRVFFTLEEIKSHTVSKEDRIRSLVPEYSNHKWLWPNKGSIVKYSFYSGRNYDLTEEMEFELRQFPLCEHDDLCLTAGTKIMTLFGNKNIEDIQIGEKVITPFGIDTVTNSKCTGCKEVVNKMGLTGTPNHKIFTYNNGEKLLDTLTFRDIISISSQKEMLRWIYRKLLFLMEQNTPLWGRGNIILASQIQIKEEKILKDFMWRFGNFIIEKKFLMAMKFIIKMVMFSITTQAILSVFYGSNIVKYQIIKLKQSLNTLMKLGILQKSGMLLKKVKSGIGNTLNFNGNIENLLSKNVLNVKKLSLVGFPEVKINFVPIFADNDIIKNQEYGTKNGSALFAIKNLLFKDIPHEKLAQNPADIRKVYNLTIKNYGVYYANNILVSNCDTMSFFNRISTIKPEKIKEIDDSPMTFGEYGRMTDERKALANKNVWNRLYAYN